MPSSPLTDAFAVAGAGKSWVKVLVEYHEPFGSSWKLALASQLVVRLSAAVSFAVTLGLLSRSFALGSLASFSTRSRVKVLLAMGIATCGATDAWKFGLSI